jgi:peptide/nickel transport system permease protein
MASVEGVATDRAVTVEAPRPRRWDVARRFGRNRLAILGCIIVLVLVVDALLAPWIMPRDPEAQNLALRRAPPGGAYLLGADEFGRDILSRLILGTRIALLVALLAVGIALVLEIGRAHV